MATTLMAIFGSGGIGSYAVETLAHAGGGDLFSTQNCRLVRKSYASGGVAAGVEVFYATEKFRLVDAGRKCRGR